MNVHGYRSNGVAKEQTHKLTLLTYLTLTYWAIEAAFEECWQTEECCPVKILLPNVSNDSNSIASRDIDFGQQENYRVRL